MLTSSYTYWVFGIIYDNYPVGTYMICKSMWYLPLAKWIVEEGISSRLNPRFIFHLKLYNF